MNAFKTLSLREDGPVHWLTLDRPDRLNAITGTMVEELYAYLSERMNDFTTRIIVLRGAGRGLCAGMDIKERAAGGDAVRSQPQSGATLGAIIGLMRACPQPIIALVHGPACGGGFAFALAADIRIAGHTARMNDAFIKLGLSGCELGLSYFLPRIVGANAAAEFMYTGNFIDAERALKIGLVSRVVADDELESAARELIAPMLNTTPLGLRRTKSTLSAASKLDDLASVISLESDVQTECMRGPDFEEALKAFTEKRLPRFVGS